MNGQGSEDKKMGSLEDKKMRSSGPTSQPLNFSTSSRHRSYVSRLTFFILFTALVGCQPPVLTPKGAAINKTNPNFLKDAGVDEKTNPHIDQKCRVCHTAPDDLLIKENPADNEIPRRRLMRTDLINLCSQCHKASVANEHTVGMETKLNRQNLPLDHEGKITCATTCHDVHIGPGRLFLREDPNTLCFSCHDV